MTDSQNAYDDWFLNRMEQAVGQAHSVAVSSSHSIAHRVGLTEAQRVDVARRVEIGILEGLIARVRNYRLSMPALEVHQAARAA